jgi:hypothetical protein
MTRFARLLLAAFLALAVPLQGLAGVTMAACASAHGPGVSADGRHDHAAMQQHAAHDHGAGQEHGHGVDAELGASSHPAHDCAACAACCSLSGGPPNTLANSGASPVPSVVIPFLESRHASVQPAGLERPPSPSLLG